MLFANRSSSSAYIIVIKQYTNFSTDNWSARLYDQTFHIFHSGWIDFRAAFYAFLCFITLCNRLKMSEYKVYWLMDFPLINSWAHLERIKGMQV